MTKLSRLLHARNFRITFIHTEFNFSRLSKLSASLGGVDGFNFETIPDGLPKDNKREAKDLPELARSMLDSKGVPWVAFRKLLEKFVGESNGVSCVVMDAQMSFAYDVVKEMGIRVFLFHTASACAVLGYLHYEELVQRGLFPLTGKGLSSTA